MSQQESDSKYPANAILPVVHLQSNEQAIEMTGMARDLGAGGVFLIDHRHETMYDPMVLGSAVFRVLDKFPDFWVGVNSLGQDPGGALKLFGATIGVNGVWSDNTLGWTREHAPDRDEWEELQDKGIALRDGRQDKAVFFGGLSMKGQGYIQDDDAAAAFVSRAKPYVDVVTTSGPGTGVSIPMTRFQTIKDVTGQEPPLALASGVDEFNLSYYLEEGADYILVGSSI